MATKARAKQKSFLSMFDTPLKQFMAFVVIFALIGGAYMVFRSFAGSARYFNPNRETSRQAMAAFLYNAAGKPAAGVDTTCGQGKQGPFKDVSGTNQFCKEIEWMKLNGYTNGYADGTFRPGIAVSRRTAAKFIYRLDGKPKLPLKSKCGAGKPGPFKDVSPKSSFCLAIDYVRSQKFLNGYSDGTFKPKSSITRKISALMIYRHEGQEDSPDQVSSTPIFVDVKDKSYAYYNPIQWMGANGYSNGYSSALPDKIE